MPAKSDLDALARQDFDRLRFAAASALERVQVCDCSCACGAVAEAEFILSRVIGLDAKMIPLNPAPPGTP